MEVTEYYISLWFLLLKCLWFCYVDNAGLIKLSESILS